MQQFLALHLTLLLSLSIPSIGNAQSDPHCKDQSVDNNYYCSLDSLNAFETLLITSDSTYIYSYCHQWIGGYQNDYGSYMKEGTLYTFHSSDTRKWNSAINMKMRLIDSQEIQNHPNSYIFCDGREKYFLFISNDNPRHIRHSLKSSDIEDDTNER